MFTYLLNALTSSNSTICPRILTRNRRQTIKIMQPVILLTSNLWDTQLPERRQSNTLSLQATTGAQL